MIPSFLSSLPDWMRIVSTQVNPVLQGYPFMSLETDPADPMPGFTYYNSVAGVVRTWDGSAWNDHY